MNLTYLSLLVAGVLPVVCAVIAKLGLKNFDNHNPRDWLARQVGFRARANAAQANSYEAFPFFAAGLLLALHAGVNPATVEQLSLAFVLARVAYIVCYVANWATLRSFVWLAGYGCVIGLYIGALRA
ncbi:MAG TPA: MAPEG family protein [Macromonas sp.]|nr:MAPEG family protein [Macromonas sp.]